MALAACPATGSSMVESGRRSFRHRASSQESSIAIDPTGRRAAPAELPRICTHAATGRRIVSPTAQAVAAQIAAIPRGAVLTTEALRTRLATRHGVEVCSAAALNRCLVFLAGVVAGDLRRGRTGRWPIWRVINENGQLPGNWPLDARWRAAVLREEGRVIRYLRNQWFTDPARA